MLPRLREGWSLTSPKTFFEIRQVLCLNSKLFKQQEKDVW